MKKIFSILLCTILWFGGKAQNCGSGGVTTLTNQTEINALMGCVHHNGAINLQGIPANADLSPLNDLQTTEGLYFVFISMVNVNAFPALTTIDGDFGWAGNTNLEEINGFPLLTSISGGIDISSNTKLKHIDGLAAIQNVSGNLKLYNNDSLGMCCGVQDLIANMNVGGNITLQLNKTSCNSQSAIISANCSYLTANKLYHARGKVYADVNTNCSPQLNEPALPFQVVVKAQPGDVYGLTYVSGNYTVELNDSITYTIQPILPDYMAPLIQNTCPPSRTVQLNITNSPDTSGFDFGVQYQACPVLRVDVGSNQRLRCAKNKTTLTYCNEGFAAAANAKVHLRLPEYVHLISAAMSYVQDGDDNYMFDVSNLDPGDCGTIHIIDSVACVSGISGRTQCTEAWITPFNGCINYQDTIGWDGSDIIITKGECKGDSIVRFVISNNGDDMVTSRPYRFFADNLLVYTGSYQLATGDSLVLETAATGATMRLEADQHLKHPGNSLPRYTIEGCNGTPGTFTLDVPENDWDVDRETDCLPITDSYVANDKFVTPHGVSSDRYVAQHTPIDYKIRFQNTGSDTIHNIILKDTLSDKLDVSSIQWGAASHTYTKNIVGEGIPVLTFTLNNTKLPPKSINEVESSGFVSFKANPLSNLPNGTYVHNRAGIYFDANPPLHTNDAWVQLYDTTLLGTAIVVNENPVIEPEDTTTTPGDTTTTPGDTTTVPGDTTSIPGDTTSISSLATSQNFRIVVLPNPFTSSLMLLLPQNILKGEARLYDIMGKTVVKRSLGNTRQLHIDAGFLPPGIYIAEVRDPSQVIGRVKVVKK